MTATELLTAVQAKGIGLTAEGARLKCDAPGGAMPPELLKALKAHRAPPSTISARPCPDVNPRYESPATHEWRRFLAVCRKHPAGWHDPRCPSELRVVDDRPTSARDRAALDRDGLTAVERATFWRSVWKASGQYPPGVKPT